MTASVFIPQLKPCFWHKIYCFYYVAYFKSYSKAAIALNTTRPSLSRAVKALEYRLNTTLLVRSTRHVALTEEGLRILGEAEYLLGTLKKIEGFHQKKDLVSHESICLFVPEPLLADYLMAPLLGFQHTYPELTVKIYPTDGLEPSSTHLVHIRLGLEQESEWVQKPLLHFEGGLYASAGYLQKWGPLLMLEDLSEHRLLLLNATIPSIFEDMNWHGSLLKRYLGQEAAHCVIHTPEHLIKMAEADFGIIAWIKDHPYLKNHGLTEILEDITALYGPQRQAYFACEASSFESEGVQALYLHLSRYARGSSGEQKDWCPKR